jgi:hypothetical protein
VYLGLLATTAVADLPVGAPPPFVSALEPSSGTHANNRGKQRPGSLHESVSRSYAIDRKKEA